MTCTQKITKCQCGGNLKRGLFNYREDGKVVIENNALGCQSCLEVYARNNEPDLVCNGEIHNVTRDGKVVDCVCIICNKSYGRNYLKPSRIKFVESFNLLAHIG